MKSFVIRSIIGIFFGAFLSVIITSTMVLSGQETLDGRQFVRNSIGNMLCGWFFTASTLYFEIHKWSLLKQTAAHFVTIMVLYFVLAYGIGWFSFTIPSFLLILAVFAILYALLWKAFSYYFKKQGGKRMSN
ncbi:DUF3021 domain-containing protein [Planococcus sp. X10-3]|uniref:DUF3021 domain-containing protein n=1 Tax=Planococcus sp. X10-3 TaxID=3061240 RepID=UPI003BB1DF7F